MRMYTVYDLDVGSSYEAEMQKNYVAPSLFAKKKRTSVLYRQIPPQQSSTLKKKNAQLPHAWLPVFVDPGVESGSNRRPLSGRHLLRQIRRSHPARINPRRSRWSYHSFACGSVPRATHPQSSNAMRKPRNPVRTDDHGDTDDTTVSYCCHSRCCHSRVPIPPKSTPQKDKSLHD